MLPRRAIQINPREWTPLGAALKDAKNKLLAAPYSLNPKAIVLLSDGEENVHPLYAEVRDELIESGVTVDTIGFGIEGEVGEETLSLISAQTGGTFRFVPSSPGTALAGVEQGLDTVRSRVCLRLCWATLRPQQAGSLVSLVWPMCMTSMRPRTRRGSHSEFVRSQRSSRRVAEAAPVRGLHREDAALCDLATKRNQLVAVISEKSWFYRQITPPATATFSALTVRCHPAGRQARFSSNDTVLIVSNPAPGTWLMETTYDYWPCPAENQQEEVGAKRVELGLYVRTRQCNRSSGWRAASWHRSSTTKARWATGCR